MTFFTGIIPPIVKVLDVGEFKVQKEAVWVITNFTSGGTFNHILYLVQHCNVIEPMCKVRLGLFCFVESDVLFFWQRLFIPLAG